MKRNIAMLILMGVAALGLIGGLTVSEAAYGSNEGTAPVAPVVAQADPAEAADNRRGPITILGNADFTPENGVLGGTGTEEDPYVIAKWEITVPAGEHYGVKIENVTAHFVLRGLVIRNATHPDGAGIRIGFAAGGGIEGCVISNSMNGIDIVASTNISMEHSILHVSGRGLRVLGETADQFRHQIAATNLFNNRTIYYFYGLDGETISGLQAGHLTVAASRNVTISNNEVVNGDGLLLAFVEDSTVTLNLAHRLANVITENGIHLFQSHRNFVHQNVVKNNRLAGIQLTLSTDNTVLGNFAHVNDTGIRLLASDNNLIQNNSVFGNITGIKLLGASANNEVSQNQVFDDLQNMKQGISLDRAIANRVERNLIFGSEFGLLLDVQAAANIVSDNTIIASDGYGIFVSGSLNTIERNLLTQHIQGILFPETFQRSITQGNIFRGNVLADNRDHVYTNRDSTGNIFTENVFLNHGRGQVADMGTTNEWTENGRGNFWGSDSVTDIDADGIGDNPVTITPSGVDDTAPLASIDVRQLGLGILGTLELGVTTIETADGDILEIPAYIADEDHERVTGFRGFPRELIDGFPGIMFMFDSEIESNFTMLTVLFDLDIAFFNAAGEWVGGTTMTAMSNDQYSAGEPFQYALELPSGSLEELGIGYGSRLVFP